MSEEIADFTGQTIGNWRIDRLLGAGGFGAVYEAENVTIVGRRAAVKILHPHLAVHAAVKQRFIHEASAASRAEHENIVQVFDGGIDPAGVCYVVMELLRDGSVLTQLLDTGPLSPARLVPIGIQIASALAAAHAHDVVHRDLKPDNIYVGNRPTRPDFVKVLDFGVAKLRDVKQTQDGAQIGTPYYMSPEQWRGIPDIDGRTDIYALGVMFYECLTARQLYVGNSNFEIMQGHLGGALPDAAALRGAPTPLIGLIRRMLAKEREDRPQSMNEVMQSLMALQLPADDLKREPAPRRPVPLLLAGLALAVATVGGIGTTLALRGGLVDRAARQLAAGRYPEAVALCEKAQATDAKAGGITCEKARAEVKNAAAYASFEKEAAVGHHDAALAAFSEITLDSPFKKRGAAQYGEARRSYLTQHLQAAKRAQAEGRCSVFLEEKQKVGSLGGDTDALDELECGAKALSTEEADEVLQKAQAASMRLRYADAIKLAQLATASNPARAYRILGAAHCALGQSETAKVAYDHLDSAGQRILSTACASYGIHLP